MAVLLPERFDTHGGMRLAGLRRHHDFATAAGTIPAQWAEFGAGSGIAGRVGDAVFGAICGSARECFESMCAVEVDSFDGVPGHLGRLRVPPRNYAVFVHDGPAAGLGRCWADIHAWLARSDYVSAETPDFERYDHRDDVRRAAGIVEIWLGVVPASARQG